MNFFKKRSALFYFNFFIMQWFFIRLAKKIDNKSGKLLGYKLIFRVPLTNWNF